MSKNTKLSLDELVVICRANKIEYLKAYGFELKFHPLAFIETASSLERSMQPKGSENTNDINGGTIDPNAQAQDEEDALYWSA
jgi:hypothetical protein